MNKSKAYKLGYKAGLSTVKVDASDVYDSNEFGNLIDDILEGLANSPLAELLKPNEYDKLVSFFSQANKYIENLLG